LEGFEFSGEIEAFFMNVRFFVVVFEGMNEIVLFFVMWLVPEEGKE